MNGWFMVNRLMGWFVAGWLMGYVTDRHSIYLTDGFFD